jgi:alpha-1,3/alpha-1,6-mannosyltransferase
MLKVRIYHPWVYLKGGAEKVLLEYVKNTRHNTELHAGYLGDDTFSELIPITTVSVDRLFEVNVKRTISSSFKSLLSILTTRLSKQPADCLLISSEGLGDFMGLLRFKSAKRTIAFVHTPLKLVYDLDSLPSTRIRLGFVRYYFFSWIIKPVYKTVNRWIWSRYDFIVANSTETRKRIINGRLAPLERIKIVYPGANLIDKSELLSSDTKHAEKKYLIAGRIMIQKNIEAGIKAFLLTKIEGATLFIAGHCDEKSKPYLQDLISHYQSENVVFIPNPNDDEYKALFQTSFCLIFPPVNEDWGIIPIEAMSYGMPVICSNQGGPSESVLDGKTGFLCEPSPEPFSKAIARVATFTPNTYKQFSNAARQRAECYTWAMFSKQLDDVIEEVDA